MIEDRLLVWRFKRGSRQALQRIYEKYHGYLLTVTAALLNDVNTALVRASLEAWAAGDYARAGALFGGAPVELLTGHYAALRPTSILFVGQPEPLQYRKPWFEVPCRYEAERDGRIEIVERELNVLAVDGQPGRWYVSIEGNP